LNGRRTQQSQPRKRIRSKRDVYTRAFRNHGQIYTETYSAQAGLSEAQFLERFGGELSAGKAGTSIGDLAVDDSYAAPAYLLGPRGLQPVD
jgi:hypothetical protein